MICEMRREKLKTESGRRRSGAKDRSERYRVGLSTKRTTLYKFNEIEQVVRRLMHCVACQRLWRRLFGAAALVLTTACEGL